MAYIFQPRLRALSIFVLLYLILGALFSVTYGRFEFTYYVAVTAGLIGVVLYMDKRVRFSSTVLWMLGIWGLLHFAGGLVEIPPEWAAGKTGAVLYDLKIHPLIPKYDQIVHAYGFGGATLAAYEAMRVHFGGALKWSPALAAILFLIGTGLGAVNELVEFIAVLVIRETNVGGYMNTGFDLVANTVGVSFALLLIRLRRAG